MKLDEMIIAVNEAETAIREAETIKDQMAKLLVGRLRGVNPSFLRLLKKELKGFNANVGEWKM